MLAQSDFKIPAPKTSTPNQPNAAPPAQAPSQTQSGTAAPNVNLGFNLGKSVSSTEIAIATAVFLVLLIPFVFAKMAVTRGLQTRLAAPGAASGAGWMFFVWLAYTALFLIVAYVGSFWAQLLIVGPGGVICLILLIIFLTMRGQALKTRR